MRAGPALCLTLMLLSACAGADKAKPPPAPLPALIQQPGRAALNVSDAESGARIVLERSQELVVRLAVVGTTGADWAPVDLKPGVLKVVAGPSFERAPWNTVSDASEGRTTWRLRPEAAGSVTLSFELRRPHARGPAERTVSYPVTVQ